MAEKEKQDRKETQDKKSDSKDSSNSPETNEDGKTLLTPAEEDEADFIIELSLNIMNNPEVKKTIQQATRAADPPLAIANFVVQFALKIDEALDSVGVETVDNIWLADGGVIEELIKQAILIANIPSQVVAEEQFSQIFDESLELLKALFQGAATNAAQQQPVGGAEQAGFPADQQGALPQQIAGDGDGGLPPKQVAIAGAAPLPNIGV